MTNSKYPAWEEWQLTAFVLDELDEETSARIANAAAENEQLSEQISALREVVVQATEVFQAEAQSEAHLRINAQRVKPLTSKAVGQSGQPRHLWIGLLGMAASIFVAVVYLLPNSGKWLLSSTSVNSSKSELAAGDQKLEAEKQNNQSAPADQSVPTASMPGSQPFQTSEQRDELVTTFSFPLPTIELPQAQTTSAAAARGTGYGGGGRGVREATAGGSAGGYGGGGYGGRAGGTAGAAMGGMSAGYGGGLGGETSGMGGSYGGSSAQSAAVIDEYEVGRPSSLAVQPSPVSPLSLELRTELAKQAEPQSKTMHRPDRNHDRYESLVENDFATVAEAPLSTFSIDVDTASYAKSRQFLLNSGRRPPAAAVRIEEFVNYFDYEYAGPQGGEPFAAHLDVATCPWTPQHKLVRIALQAKKVELSERPQANIVFLLDVSGSMGEANKLPLVKESMRMLTKQLGENDKIAIAVYAGAAGCVLEGTRGDNQAQILSAIENLNAGGSTNGAQGIQLAYDLARDNFVPGGINRVILCTDGDFNVGVTSTEALVDLVADNARSKIFLTVLGFGMGNTNDAMMEQISNRGNGVYGFVDSRREAHRQMVQQLAGNLMTVAKDVKIQVEFNPAKVKSYRLVGYENRVMAAEDFNNDKKDAGEIGAGHRVTALYELVPFGVEESGRRATVDELRYQTKVPATELPGSGPDAIAAEFSDELLAVKLRYKQPEGDVSQLQTFPLKDSTKELDGTDRDFQWAASMAQFAMLLKNSRYVGQSNWDSLLEQAIAAAGVNPDAARQECLEMIRKCKTL